MDKNEGKGKELKHAESEIHEIVNQAEVAPEIQLKVTPREKSDEGNNTKSTPGNPFSVKLSPIEDYTECQEDQAPDMDAQTPAFTD